MKVHVALAAVFLVLGGVALIAQNAYVPKPDEELYKTWENDFAYPQRTVNFPGGYKDYNFNADTTPSEQGEEQIMKRWTDSDGNVWYWLFGKVTVGQYAGVQYQTLTKISHNGTLRELVFRAPVYAYNPNSPMQIDPDDLSYRVYHRYGN